MTVCRLIHRKRKNTIKKAERGCHLVDNLFFIKKLSETLVFSKKYGIFPVSKEGMKKECLLDVYNEDGEGD